MIGGIISLIIGIILLGATSYISNQINTAGPRIDQGIAICNSDLGRLGSILSGNVAEKCNQELPQAITLLNYANILDPIIFIAGVFCIILGLVLLIRELKRSRRITNQTKV